MTSIAERHKYILECLNRNGFIKVNDIAKDLEVTPVTIRKDLKYLEEKKLLYRTHGSASPINPVTPEINRPHACRATDSDRTFNRSDCLFKNSHIAECSQ